MHNCCWSTQVIVLIDVITDRPSHAALRCHCMAGRDWERRENWLLRTWNGPSRTWLATTLRKAAADKEEL